MRKNIDISCADECPRQPGLPGLPEWPGWLDDLRLPDESFSAAYEHLPPAFRAALKTALALSFFHFGECGALVANRLESPRDGFWRSQGSRPAPWALAILDQTFEAPARLLAACVLPPLCGVPLYGAICLDGGTAPQNLLALELCGVEDVFCLARADLERLLEEMPGPGRIVLLGNALPDWHAGFQAGPGCQDSLQSMPRPGVGNKLRAVSPPCDPASNCAPNIRIYRENPAPGLYAPQPGLYDMEILSLAQGVDSAALTRPSNGPLDALYAALTPEDWAADAPCAAENEQLAQYITQRPAHQNLGGTDLSKIAARLILAPGLEAFWLHEGLTPEFFRQTTVSFGTNWHLDAGTGID